MRTVAEVAGATQVIGARLPAPKYVPREGPRLALGVASMRTHTTDEGWQLMLGLREGGYKLCGYGEDCCIDVRSTNVLTLLSHEPSTLVLQDKREWTGRTAGKGFDVRETYTYVPLLQNRREVFKGVVLKDAHSDQLMHADCAKDVGAHFWVTYYHSSIVAAQAPYARPEHMVRTYHSLDADAVPMYAPAPRFNRALLSGAVSAAYPLRARLFREHATSALSLHVDTLRHPGYGRARCHTREYLGTLSHYKVAICTSSRFGYAVRKIAEATACGCRVVTDLPVDEAMPYIDDNLVRVPVDISVNELRELIADLCSTYDPARQEHLADAAKEFYDYRALGRKLSSDIEELRRVY